MLRLKLIGMYYTEVVIFVLSIIYGYGDRLSSLMGYFDIPGLGELKLDSAKVYLRKISGSNVF